MLILFVECHASFRQSASFLMDREDDMEVVSQAGSVAEARARLAEGGIEAAIVVVPLPDEGAEGLVRSLREANPAVPVLVMTHLADPAVREGMLGAGANEVLDKDATFPEVLEAVRRLEDR